ncbi:MAG: NAD(P)-dependent oxidoreductase [Kiloniellales bacterium]|nr:NAD(P)-dependent oxidoreductase [Kiloniellales bacterium]
MSDPKPTLGFIGLGLMGTPMAVKLREAGYPLVVWGRTPAKLAPALALGAREAASPRAVAAESEAILLCVTDTQAVETLVFGEDGIAAGGSAGKLLIDHSSIRPDATRSMAERLASACGMDWIDAPVSGGPVGVESKTLVVMAGGEAAPFSRAEAILAAYAGRVTRMGPVGAGQTTKLINQALCGVGFAVMAEIAALARDAGIDAEQIPPALAGGRADSRLLQEYLPRMARRDFALTARIDIILKDLGMVADFAHETGSALPITSMAAELHRLATENGLGAEDNAALVRLYDRPE